MSDNKKQGETIIVSIENGMTLSELLEGGERLVKERDEKLEAIRLEYLRSLGQSDE